MARVTDRRLTCCAPARCRPRLMWSAAALLQRWRLTRPRVAHWFNGCHRAELRAYILRIQGLAIHWQRAARKGSAFERPSDQGHCSVAPLKDAKRAGAGQYACK